MHLTQRARTRCTSWEGLRTARPSTRQRTPPRRWPPGTEGRHGASRRLRTQEAAPPGCRQNGESCG
eukprot:4207134-Alexandrium_andersonii.AAC.1